jgi:hypothetical protein
MSDPTILEPKPRRVIRKHERPNRDAHRQFSRTMKPIGSVIGADMHVLSQAILRRIRQHRHATNGGSYVLGDQVGNVYVLPIVVPTTTLLIRVHEAWLLGTYASGLRCAFPTVDELHGDLTQHFHDLRVLAA